MKKFLKALATVTSWVMIGFTGLVFLGLLDEPKDVVDSVATGCFVMLGLSVVGAAWLISSREKGEDSE